MNREIFRIGIPALGALAADPLVSLIDTAFVARLGEVPLAALGVDTAILSVAFVAFNFLAYGTGTIIAHAVGRNDSDDIRGSVTTSMAMAVALGVVGLIVLLAGAQLWVQAMSAPAEVVESAVTYLRIRAWAAPAVLIVTTGHGVFRGLQDTATPLKITLILNIVNVVLDALFIFGLGWGIAGAAYATVAAQWVGAAWFLRLVLPYIDVAEITRRRTVTFLTVGRQLTVRTGSLLATFTLATRLATELGTNSIAAHQVVSQLWLFSTLVLDALAIAAQALVGRYLGEGDLAEVNRLVRRLAVFGLVGGLGLAGLLGALTPFLGSLFGTPDAVTMKMIGLMPIVILLQPLGGLLFVGDGAFMGALRFRFLSWTAMGSAVVSIAWLVTAGASSLRGIWIGISLLLALRLFTQVIDYGRRGSVAA